MSDAPSKAQKSVAAQIAEESALAHHGLRVQFERIERALKDGDLHKGAHLLNDLIDQAREHFTNEESIALGAGLTSSVGGRLLHDIFMERARRLKERYFNRPANTDFSHDIEAKLVVLLSDLVESDLRIEQRIGDAVGGKAK